MADSEYNILLGVEVDTSGIAEKINSYKPKDPIKIDLDIKGAEAKIKTLKEQLASLSKPIEVPVKPTTKTSGTSTAPATTPASPSPATKKQIDETTIAYKKLMSLQKEMSKLRVDQGILEIKGGNEKQIEKITARLKELRREYADTAAAMKTPLSDTQKASLALVYDEASRKIEDFRVKYTGAMSDVSKKTYESMAKADEKAAAKMQEAAKKTAQGIRLDLELGTFDAEISKVDNAFDRLSNAPDELKRNIDEAKAALQQMETVAERIELEDPTGTGYVSKKNADELIAANNRYKASIEKVSNALKMQAMEERALKESQTLQNDREIFQLKIDAWLTKNSAATKQFGASMLSLKAQAEKCDKVTLGRLEKEFKKIDLRAEKAGVKMLSLGDRIKLKFKELTSYFSVASLFMYGTQALKGMFEQVKLIDSAMTELKKVTNETDASYNEFLTNAASRAKELGTTIDGLVSSTAEFAKLGYGFEESQELAEVANIYAVVGDEIEGVEGATESLVSTLAAFRNEAGNMSETDFAMEIVDKFNEVANQYSISSGGIGEAMKRSASSMEAANNTIDESIALITAANEVVQDPETVGQAFKTISMRIRGAKTE